MQTTKYQQYFNHLKDTNISSRKCVLANNGVYEDSRTLANENIKLERYWIDLTK